MRFFFGPCEGRADLPMRFSVNPRVRPSCIPIRFISYVATSLIGDISTRIRRQFIVSIVIPADTLFGPRLFRASRHDLFANSTPGFQRLGPLRHDIRANSRASFRRSWALRRDFIANLVVGSLQFIGDWHTISPVFSILVICMKNCRLAFLILSTCHRLLMPSLLLSHCLFPRLSQ